MTKAEKRLWYDGLIDQRLGYRFRRQYPIGIYVLDFYCPEAKLCVEVDGDAHELRQEQDARRDQWLADKGVLTYRVPNDSVMLSLGEILHHIRVHCEDRTIVVVPEPPPCPPPPLRAGGRLVADTPYDIDDEVKFWELSSGEDAQRGVT